MKKVLGILLVMTLLVGILPMSAMTVSAAEKLDIYEDFENFDGTGWAQRADTGTSGWTPGWVIGTGKDGNGMQIGHNQYTIVKFGEIYDEGKMHISFDMKKDSAVNKDIMLYLCGVSDTLMEKDSETYQDKYDYSVFADGTGTLPEDNNYKNVIARNLAGTNTVITYTDAWSTNGVEEDGSSAFDLNEWTRFDIYIDQKPAGTASPYDVFINGVEISTDETALSTTNAGGAHTALGFGWATQCDTQSTTWRVHIDNVKIERYDNEAPAPELIFVSGDNVAGVEKEVSVKLTEGLNKTPELSDIEIKNADGVEVEGFTITNSTPSGFTIGTEELEGGKYTLGLKDTAYGAGTKLQPETAEFFVTDLNNSVANTPYYYMNEDFNTYTGITTGTYKESGDPNYEYVSYGDIPVGWVDQAVFSNDVVDKSQINEHWTKDAKMVNATEEKFVRPEKVAEGNYALKMTANLVGGNWDEGICYYFPTGVASGDFTLEFDVKTTAAAGWKLSYVNYDNWDSMYARQDGYINADVNGAYASVTQNHARVALMGMPNDSSNLMVNNTINMTTLDTDTNLDISADTWTNVKAEFNLNTGVYLITVTPQGGASQTYTWTDGARGRFEKGVKGIGLTRNAQGGDTLFDNIKVYKNDSYYINDNFNDYVDGFGSMTTAGWTREVSYTPSGWWKNNTQFAIQWGTTQISGYSLRPGNIRAAERTEGDDSDKVMQLDTDGTMESHSFFKAFPRAMGSGTPFVVSFDVKTTNSAGWKLYLPNQSHLNMLEGFNRMKTSNDTVTTKLADSSSTVVKWRTGWANLQEKCVVLSKYTNETSPRGNTKGLLEVSMNDEPTLSDITVQDGTWYTYTLTVTPAADGSATVKLSVVNADNPDDWESGGEATYTISKYHNNTDWYQWPAAGIGFTKRGGNGAVNIDNVKVYETPTVDAESGLPIEATTVPTEHITAIRVEYADGSVQTLDPNAMGQVVKPGVTRIAVEFSSPLSILEADQVLQPLDVIKTSKLVLAKDPDAVISTVMKTGSALATANLDTDVFTSTDYLNQYKDCIARYKVYDVLDDVIQFKRLGDVSEKTVDVAVTKSLSSDKKTCYFDFEEMLTENVDYVLTVDRNIPFSSSIYAGLEENAVVKLGVKNENAGVHITELAIERKAGSVTAPVKSVEDLKAQLALGNAAKLIIHGYNDSSEDVDLFVASGQYEVDSVTGANSLGCCIAEKLTLEAQTLNAKLEYDLTMDDAKIIDALKCFVWRQDDLSPLIDALELK